MILRWLKLRRFAQNQINPHLKASQNHRRVKESYESYFHEKPPTHISASYAIIKIFTTGKGIRSIFHHEIQRYLLNRIIYLEYETYLQEKIRFSEFSLFMCVWASLWLSLDICTRMFGVYFTLCLPLGNARWKNEAKKSPEFCHFPEWSGAKRKQLNRWTDWTRSLGSRAMRIARLFGNFTNVPTKF